LRLLLLFFLTITFAARYAAAQEPATKFATETPPDLDNKHVKVSRYAVGAREEVALPKLVNESMVICLRGDMLKHVPEKGPAEIWEEGPGSAVWNRGGVSYWIENSGETTAELLVVELKDSYAMGQVRVPWSERDPVALNPRAIRVVLENEHVRLLRMRLDPRQSTMESQFPVHMEIALQAGKISKTEVYGRSVEAEKKSGEVRWENGDLISVANLGETPIDYLILELKHPFCYPHRAGFALPRGMDPAMEPYLRKVHEMIEKKWIKDSPRVARREEKGWVYVGFVVDQDGTLSEDDMRLRGVFAGESLVELALNTLRKAAPFPPLPEMWTKPKLEMRMTFALGLPQDPQGCGN